jgi:hypothetical protein
MSKRRTSDRQPKPEGSRPGSHSGRLTRLRSKEGGEQVADYVHGLDAVEPEEEKPSEIGFAMAGTTSDDQSS